MALAELGPLRLPLGFALLPAFRGRGGLKLAAFSAAAVALGAGEEAAAASGAPAPSGAGAGARATGLLSSAAGAEVPAALAAEAGSRVAAAEDAVNGYNAHQVAAAVARVPSLRIEIVKRSDDMKGFAVLPRRWVVERTFSWFERNRRLAKDWENLATTLQTFIVLASIQLAIRRLAP